MNDLSPSRETRFRAADLSPSSLDAEARTVEVIWTTGATVRRYSWTDGEIDEELEVSPTAIDLRRLNAGAAVLNSHRSGQLADVIGSVVPGSVRVAGGQGVALIKISDRPDVEGIWSDIRAGVIRNVSVGYSVERYDVTREDGKRPLYRATSWTPLEISLVAIPADADAQIRSNEATALPAQVQERTDMNTQTQTRAVPSPEVISAERQRCAAILALYQRHGMVDKAPKAIEDNLTIEQARAAVLDELAARTAPAGARTEPTLTGFHNERVTQRQLLEDAMTVLVNPDHQLLPGNRPVRNIDDLAERYCRAMGIRYLGVAEATRAFHSSSDFPLITANVLRNEVARRIAQVPPAIVRAARQITRPDYNSGNNLALSAASALQNVGEAGELNAVTIDEKGEALPVPRDLGAIFNITRRAMVQDFSGVFSRIADSMNRAAIEKLRNDTLAPLLANSGNGMTMRSGQPMFSAANNNKAASGGALSITTLSAARQAMRLQADSRGAKLAIEPWALLVHPAQETLAQQLLTSISAQQTGNVNPFGGALELLVEPGLTSTTGWYLIADPAQYDGLTIATLEGQEAPDIQTRDSWSTLGAEMRMVWALDCRFIETATWYFNPGA